MISRELKENLTPFLTGDHEAFASTLLMGLILVYGPELLDWDGATIQLEVKEDFGVDMPRRVYDRLMGLLTALSTDQVYKDVPVFDEIVSALSGRGFGTEKDIPPVDHVAWAVTELQLVDPEPVSRNPEDRWSRDIKKYARVVLDDEGMPIAPQALDFAADRTVKKEGMSDNAYYAGAWGSAQARANEVDQWVDSKVVELIEQLAKLGINMGLEQPEVQESQAKTAVALPAELLDELEARIHTGN